MEFIFFLVRARPEYNSPCLTGFQGGPTESWNWSGQGPARWETMGPRDPGWGAPSPRGQRLEHPAPRSGAVSAGRWAL